MLERILASSPTWVQLLVRFGSGAADAIPRMVVQCHPMQIQGRKSASERVECSVFMAASLLAVTILLSGV